MEKFLNQLAQETHPELSIILILTLFLLGLICLLLVFVMIQLGQVYNQIQAQEGKEPWQAIFSNLYKEQAGLTPIEKEAQLVIASHDYDGIQELDNHLPPWWKNLFYVTVGFSIVYVVMYHLMDLWPSQLNEYKTELAVAQVEKAEYEKTQINSINEQSVKFLTDAATLDEGKSLFVSKCTACHAVDGGGGVGPNLTDNYWLHGNGIADIFRTIKEGVPGKGMVAWQTSFNPKQMQAIASYVKKLEGSKPAAPKEPQGTLIASEKQSQAHPDSSRSKDAIASR